MSFASRLTFPFRVHRVVSRAERAGKVAQRSRNNAHALSLWPPFQFLQEPLQWVKQGRPCLSDPSSDNDDFGIERVDDGCDPCSKVIHRSQPDVGCFLIAIQMRL